MTEEAAIEQTATLVEEYRDRCLWFWRRDFVPGDASMALKAIELIERYGDRAAYLRCRELRLWLSPPSNPTS